MCKCIVIKDGVVCRNIMVENKVECVHAIMEEYFKWDSSMYDVLASIEIRGFSAEDVVSIYAECMNKSDSDVIIHFRGDYDLNSFEDYEILGL